MNPFFDISSENEIPENTHQLNNLGQRRIYASFGKRIRGDWGETTNFESNHIYTEVSSKDYDRQFVSKLLNIRPSYRIDEFINHHYKHFLSTNSEDTESFLKHMRYEILPILKKLTDKDSYIELFEIWLKNQNTKPKEKRQTQKINNTINIGTANAPIQIQQNTDYSTQTHSNQISKDQITEFLEILRKDIREIDVKIREDFFREMEYATIQLTRNKNIRAQLSSIGELMKEVGIGTFTNLVSAPVFEIIRPFLGL